MRKRRYPIGLACATLAAVLLSGSPLSQEAQGEGKGRKGEETFPRLRITSVLPEWVAPGALLRVEGWAGAHQAVSLSAGKRLIAKATSGPRGRFRLRGVAPASGRYRIEVRAGDARASLGVLRVRPLLLVAVGDVTFGDRVARAVATYGPRYPWRSVASTLRSADLATANLEGAVSTRGAPVPGKEFHFRGPPAALAAAARFAGLDVVTLANNHSLDFGREAFLDTLRHAGRYGVATVGAGRDLVDARRPAVLEAGGFRIAFLAYSDVRPEGFTAGAGAAGTAPADPALIGADVRDALRRADLAVVWFHWGEELARAPNSRQEVLAAAALNAGASIVLGAHPHVLQPIARPDRRRLVAWSLGNFVFPASSPHTARTGILRAEVGASGVLSFSLRPVDIVGVRPRF